MGIVDLWSKSLWDPKIANLRHKSLKKIVEVNKWAVVKETVEVQKISS